MSDTFDADAVGAVTVPGVDVATLNLEQALVDFEIANARVLDLTRRLTTLNAEVMQLRAQNEMQRQSIVELEQRAEAATAEVAVVRSSLAYRTMRILGDFRSRFRR